MRQPLGRIEREYVVGEISRAKPSFELSLDGCPRDTVLTEYTLNGDLVSFSPPRGWGYPKVFAASIRFLHRKRYMRFTSEVKTVGDIASFRLPEKIMPDNDAEDTAGERFVVSYSGRTCRCAMEPSSPDGIEGNVPGETERILALSERIGLPADHTPAGARLYRFVLGVRDDSCPVPTTDGKGLCLFLDNRVALVALADGRSDASGGSSPASERTTSVSVYIGSRSIRFPARVLGTMRVNERVIVLALDCDEAHEEDKRVLYERQYKSLYR